MHSAAICRWIAAKRFANPVSRRQWTNSQIADRHSMYFPKVHRVTISDLEIPELNLRRREWKYWPTRGGKFHRQKSEDLLPPD